MGLSVKRVEKLLRGGVPGRHTDGDVRGLMLCIEGKKSAHWLLRFQINHVVRHMGLGSARDLSLAAARERARRERERLASGVDPLTLRQNERAAAAAAAARRLTFKQAAEQCHEALAPGWTNPHHANEFISSLQRWVFPHIGNLDIAAVDKDSILRVLEQKTPREEGTFWVRRAVTADRVRNRIERVLDWAEARGKRPEGTPNPARWKGFLDQLLAAPRKIAPVQNMAAMPYDELPGVMQLLAADQSVGAQVVRFIVMTSCRLGEALRATWDEVDFDAAEWVIPASRMKGRKGHRVPLSPQVLTLLKSLPREENNPYLFVSSKTPLTHVAESTVTEALRRGGCKQTLHGMRSAFSTWAHERTSFPGIIVELSLAHRVGNAVENAYRRTDLATKRRKLMEAWGKYCCTPPAAVTGAVVPMRERRGG
jgi:integrase